MHILSFLFSLFITHSLSNRNTLKCWIKAKRSYFLFTFINWNFVNKKSKLEGAYQFCSHVCSKKSEKGLEKIK